MNELRAIAGKCSFSFKRLNYPKHLAVNCSILVFEQGQNFEPRTQVAQLT